MKKLLTLAAMACTLTAATTAHAQETTKKKSRNAISYTSVGPVIGLGHSWVTGDLGAGISKKFNFSPAIGIGLVYSKNEHWGLGGELLVSREGLKVEEDINTENSYSIRPLYLRLPLHVSYFFGKYGDNIRPKVYLGPTFGVKLNEQYKDADGNSTSVSGSEASFKSFDLGVNAGVGVNIKVATRTWLNLDAGYTYGLLNCIKDADESYHNSNLRLNIGVMFGL